VLTEVGDLIETLRAPEERKEWYRPGPSCQAFHDSPADVRVLIGGRGSGKTTSVAVDVLRHATNYAGARILCVRKTQVANDDTSVMTFNETYTKWGFKMDLDEELSLFRKWNDGLTVRVPSNEAMAEYNKFRSEGFKTKAEIRMWIENVGDRLCSYIMFRGLKDEDKSEGQLRGFECSMFVMIEADLLQESDLDLAIPCLRWKDAHGEYIPDYSIILDTNPPGPRHWIAKLEKQALESGDTSYQFWHIKTEENRGNLRPGYIEALEKRYAGKPAHRKRYLMGEYAELFDGSPVFHKFRIDKHAFDDIPWPIGAYLVRGWDFGATHANIWSAYFRLDFEIGRELVPIEYWWDLHEYYAEMSDIDRQCQRVQEITEDEFPFHNDRNVCAGIMDFCDPAGAQKGDKGSSIEVMNKNGIWPVYQTAVRSLDTTISIVNRLMQSRDPNGRVQYRVDRKNCPRLFLAHSGEYRWPKPGEAGFNTGLPIKGPQANGADHLEDASRYPKINCLRLAKKVIEEQKPKTGVLSHIARKSLNPLKKDY
jgi:Terminase large subunit, T4likevirus-type, N-terminal